MKKSIFFYKELTPAEVGNTGTHEIYVRLPNNFDYESFFNDSAVENGSVLEVNFSAQDTTDGENAIVPLRFVYFHNSNGEKRIPSLGTLFQQHNVQEGDIVCLESRIAGANTTYFIHFYKKGEIQVNPNSIYFSCIKEDNDRRILKSTIDQPLQQIFYGAPGTGKSHKIKELTGKDNVIRTTFHPDSDYSTFVGCYKPTTNVVNIKSTFGGKAVNVVNEKGEPEKETKIVYEFVEQAFLQAYVNAWKLYAEAELHLDIAEPEKQYLIIEEINRGNCAQIFGDLFQLLDRNDDNGFSDYYIKADSDMCAHLKKAFEEQGITHVNVPSIGGLSADEAAEKIISGEILVLPNNLYIWATMNTSDQSLFPIDSAFKRRWDWKYMPIANEGKGWTINIGQNIYDWWTFLEVINNKIEDATYSEDKKLGYFFCKAKDGVIDAQRFVGKVLFYLWNDVFKDTDLAESLLKDEDGKKSFDKFYTPLGQGETKVDTSRVIEFMEKLEVKPLIEGEETEEDDDSEENDDFVDENVKEGADVSSKGIKDTSVYSVNGEGSLRKRNVPYRVVSIYVEKNPYMSATDIVREWNALGTMVTVVITEDEYNRKKERSTDSIFETRYNEIRLNNGEKIYVFNQFNPERIKDFASKVNAQPWGIQIEKVAELRHENTL